MKQKGKKEVSREVGHWCEIAWGWARDEKEGYGRMRRRRRGGEGEVGGEKGD